VNYGENLEETIHTFSSMKGLLFMKEMMDDRNANKFFVIILLKIVGSIVNGNENAVKVFNFT